MNGDGRVDACEMARYLHYLQIPESQCMQEAQAEIDYILGAATPKRAQKLKPTKKRDYIE